MQRETRSLLATLVCVVVVVAGCAKTDVPISVSGADSIYFGGNVITINDAQPSAEAVAIKNGKIVAVGTRTEVEKAQKGANTRLIDLAGKTLIPGFVDGHGHFLNVGIQTATANLLPPHYAHGLCIRTEASARTYRGA